MYNVVMLFKLYENLLFDSSFRNPAKKNIYKTLLVFTEIRIYNL